MMLKAAGASVISLPSNEIYAAMQTGAMDAAMTSSTSFISFKLEEIAKHLTTGRNKAYWFMFEPLLMSKDIFAKLPKAQQDIVMAAGAEQEKFATDAARADDKIVADVYAKAGAKVFDIDEATCASGRPSPATPRGRTTASAARRRGAVDGGAEAAVSEPGADRPGAPSTRPARRRASLPPTRQRRRAPASTRRRRALLRPLARALALRQPRRWSARHAGAARRLAGADLERRLALLPEGVDRLAGRGRRVLPRRRDLPLRRVRAVDARPRRHRGARAAAARARATACAARSSTCCASPSAPSSRGSRGRCCTRPGSTARRPRRRGRRRCGFRTG